VIDLIRGLPAKIVVATHWVTLDPSAGWIRLMLVFLIAYGSFFVWQRVDKRGRRDK